MIVTAVVRCEWCGAQVIIPVKKTTRSFNIAFNKLKREHDWGCEENAKRKEVLKKRREEYDQAGEDAADIVNKIITGDL